MARFEEIKSDIKLILDKYPFGDLLPILSTDQINTLVYSHEDTIKSIKSPDDAIARVSDMFGVDVTLIFERDDIVQLFAHFDAWRRELRM